MYGDCWHLAETIAVRSEYPVVTFQRIEGNVSLWSHAGNRLPDGRIVDIEGIFEEEEWLLNWALTTETDPSAAYAKDWTLEEWRKEIICTKEDGLTYPDISENAVKYADEVVTLVS